MTRAADDAPAQRITVLCADDHRIVREGLRMIIATLLDYGVSRDMLTLMTQVHPAELLNLSV